MFSGNDLRSVRSFWRVGLAALLPVAVAGCSSEPYETIPVSGKITLEDGSLVPAGVLKVLFVPQVEPIDAKTHPRPAYGLVNVRDGTFGSDEYAVTSVKFGDGVTIGPQKVKVFGVFFDDKGTEQEMQMEVTPSEVEVGPESTEFEFKVKMPPGAHPTKPVNLFGAPGGRD